MERQRNYGIDLLRIISMFFVVILHFLGNGGINDSSNGIQFYASWTITVLTYCAVDIFALVSGYVGINSKHKSITIISLWSEVLFYSVIITSVLYCIMPENITKSDFVGAFFPIFSKRYWYFSAYFILYLFMPLINNGINELSQKQHLYLAMLIFGVFSLIPTFTGIIWGSDPFDTIWGCSAIWLISLYVIGSYFGKYRIVCSKIVMVFVYFISASVVLFGKFYNLSVLSQTLTYTSPFVLLCGITLLILFSNIQIKDQYGKHITKVSSAAFAVYLVDTHPIIFKYVTFNRFSYLSQYPIWKMLPIGFGICFLIYAFSSLIEFLLNAKMKMYNFANSKCTILATK